MYAQTLCSQFGALTPNVTIGVNANSTVFASTLGVSTYQQQNIVINGQLILDVPLTFNLCNVKLGAGAEIAVLNGQELVFSISKVFACQNMWKGIRAVGASTIKVLNSHIEDAQYAVSADDLSVLIVTGSTFDRNYVGIRNFSASGGATGLNLVSFSGNLFTCSSQLNLPYPGQTPLPGTISYSGLLLNQCTASVGNAFAFVANVFSKMRYGIYADKSDVTVATCVFKDMDAVFFDATGILAQYGTLKVVGTYVPFLNTYYGGSSFTNCGFAGVDARGANLQIRNGNFKGSQVVGISSEDNQYAQEVDISLNAVEMEEVDFTIGINLERSQASGTTAHNRIYDNKDISIKGSTAGRWGIRVVAPFPAIDLMEIEGNKVTVTSTANKIHPIQVDASQGDNFKVLSNEVAFNSVNSADTRWGISMLGLRGRNHEVSYNNVAGSGTHNPGQCAIHIEESTNVTLCANVVNHTDRGLHFRGNNSPCHVIGNTIKAHQDGLFISQSPSGGTPQIGEQLRRSNTWSLVPGDYSSRAARCALGVSSALSRIRTETPSPSSVYPSLALIEPALGWFSHDPGPANSNCSGGGKKLSGLEEGLLSGTYLAEDAVSPAEYWEISYGFMCRLWEDEGLLEEVPGALDFFNSHAGLALGQLAEITLRIKEAALPPSTLQEQLDELRSQRDGMMWELIALENSQSSEEEPSPTYISAKQGLFADITALREQEEGIMNEMQAIRVAALQEVENLNEGISLENSFEVHQAALNRYIIKRLLGLVDETAEAVMRYIALEVDLAEGAGVPGRARQWLPLRERAVFFGESERDGDESQESRLHTAEEASSITWQLLPSPANTTLSILLPPDFSGFLSVVGMTGQTIFTKVLEGGEDLVLDTSNWPNGLYVVRLESQSTGTEVKKIIIQH